jgi:hypothetical protein
MVFTCPSTIAEISGSRVHASAQRHRRVAISPSTMSYEK